MWAPAASPSRWGTPRGGASTASGEAPPLNEEIEESLLLQDAAGLGPSKETHEAKKIHRERETNYPDVVVSSETTGASADNSSSSSNCSSSTTSTSSFSSMGLVKAEKQQELPQSGVSLGTTETLFQKRRLFVDGMLPQIDPPLSSQVLQPLPNKAPGLLGSAAAPCGGTPLVSPLPPLLIPRFPLGTFGGTAVTAAGGGAWTSHSSMLPLLYGAGEAGEVPVGSGGFCLPSLLLGPPSQGPLLSSGAAAPGPAHSAAAGGHRLSGCCGFKAPRVAAPALSVGGEGGSLGPWSQQQHQQKKQQQQQQQTGLQRHPFAFPGTARTSSNIPIILTALRRHLRSLIRMMYCKPPLEPPTDGSSGQEARSPQRASSQAVYAPGGTSECGGHFTSAVAPSPSRRCSEAVPSAVRVDKKRWQAATVTGGTVESLQDEELGVSMGSLATQQHRLGVPCPSPHAAETPPTLQAGSEGGPEGSARARAVFASSSSGTAAAAGNAAAAPFPPVSSGDAAAEGWEGQCSFHEAHLEACSLSNLSEYLLILSPFLGLPLQAVARQDPSTLQHVRLQLLLLRTNQQQQRQQQTRQSKPLQRRWPSLQQSAAAAVEGEGDSNDCETRGAPRATPCCPQLVAGPSLPPLPFGSSSSPLLPSFSSSAGAQIPEDEASAAASAISGEQTAKSRGAAGDCEGPAAAPLQLGCSAFPSSSVDAFSVDGPASNGSFSRSSSSTSSRTAATAACPLSSPDSTTAVSAPANDAPAAAAAAAAAVLVAAKERSPVLWGPGCSSAATTAAAAAAAALRWSPVGANAVGLRLPGLLGGSSFGLGDSLYLAGGSTAGMAQDGTAAAATAAAATAAVAAARGSTNGGLGSLTGGAAAGLVPPSAPAEWMREGAIGSAPSGAPQSSYYMLHGGGPAGSFPSLPFVGVNGSSRARELRSGAPTNPADLGLIISAEGLGKGRSQKGNVQVTFSPQMGAWVVCCASGLMQQSRAFSVAALGFEGAKKTAQQYATHCRRQCSSKRASDRAAKGKGGQGGDDGGRGGHRGLKETNRRSGSAVTPIPQVTLGIAGPAGRAFNLAKTNTQEFILPKSDFSASRVARLSRRAMELPYVHGVRFEAANFAWVAQMRGETRRFLVKKHGFVKSRLCAIEKIEIWRAALSPEELANELKAEQDVLAMVPTTCPEETDPEAMQAAEESLRLKFQREALMPRNTPQTDTPIGVKRQRNAGSDTERAGPEGPTSHELAPEHLLLQEPQQQVMAAQHLHAQSSALQRQHLLEHAQEELLQHAQQPLLRPPISGDHLAGGDQPLQQQQQQQVMLPLQSLRTAGQQQQQILLQQFSAPITALPGQNTQQHLIGSNSHLVRAPDG